MASKSVVRSTDRPDMTWHKLFTVYVKQHHNKNNNIRRCFQQTSVASNLKDLCTFPKLFCQGP